MVVCSEDRDGPQLPRFYADREVLITGATGFMGKVLVERLLSTCTKIRRLHLVVRDKRGLPPNKRLDQLKQSLVFDNIRAQYPSQLDKLVVVPGDVTLPQLGLDTKAIRALKEVSVVFHNAATTKFIDPLHSAVLQNISSALHVMDVCDQLPALQVLIHVSTGFSNIELHHIEERVYEQPVSVADVFKLLENNSPEEIDKITANLIHPKRNTYFFTKALAEVAVAERQHRNYSVTIFRPTIVISAHRAPFPGWIEGLSGMTGVVASSGQGLLKVTHFDPECMADVVPVDVAIDNMIAVAWETAVDRPVETRVYYCGSLENPLLWGEVHAELARCGPRLPFDSAFSYPFFVGARNRYLYKTLEFVLQTAPLHIAGLFARLCGVKPRVSLNTVAQRLSTMSGIQGDISCREWTFNCDNMRHLRDKLRRTDGHLFYLDIRDMNWVTHIANFHLGTRKYLLRQKDETLVRAKQHMRRLRVIHNVLKLVLALIGCKLFKLLVLKLSRIQNRSWLRLLQ